MYAGSLIHVSNNYQNIYKLQLPSVCAGNLKAFNKNKS